MNGILTDSIFPALFTFTGDFFFHGSLASCNNEGEEVHLKNLDMKCFRCVCQVKFFNKNCKVWTTDLPNYPLEVITLPYVNVFGPIFKNPTQQFRQLMPVFLLSTAYSHSFSYVFLLVVKFVSLLLPTAFSMKLQKLKTYKKKH